MTLVLLLGALCFMYRRQLRYLHFFQQEEYNGRRFLAWVLKARAFDKRGTLILLLSAWVGPVLGGLSLFAACLFEVDPRIEGKVRLRMTQRATAIFYTSMGMLLAALVLWPIWIDTWLGAIVLVQMLPLILVLASLILLPFEKRKQEKFILEAKAILNEVNPLVIGITGSFGKTSTKEALARMLQVTLGATFWPPKSYNTQMGITRELRERLEKGHEYAVIEMGAYTRGSIKRLCELTPPGAALITGVGLCHYDRFGSHEDILSAKSELAQANRGILVCNGDNEGSRKIAELYPGTKTLLYGFEGEGLDCHVLGYKISLEGTDFTLEWASKIYEGKTAHWGKAALSNIVGAFTMACALGADPVFALAVIRTLEPVSNRLQVKKEGDVWVVHDAFNSNPVGFASALDVMRVLPAKRRMVMTPGMIELGKLQKEENFRAAKMAGECCDLALVVGKTNREPLVEGFKMGGMLPEQIHLVDSRKAAFEKMATLKREDDLILIENDLTDIYEAQLHF